MKQLVQNYKSGELKLVEVPTPLVSPGQVLVRNVNSVVSIGTEKLMMGFAKKSLLGKALARPDLARQVIDFARNEGLLKAYQQATRRLDNLTPLGYSCAGVVLNIGEGVDEFGVNDRVTCSRGGFASHAEVINVPKNFCVKIPENVAFEEAAFTTVGAISLHTMKLCELNAGDKVAIIGLGLLGQIAVQIAKANGYQVFGIDSDSHKVSLMMQIGADEGAVVGKDDVLARARSFTKGVGFDSVVILASTLSNEPLKTAAEVCHERGRIVVPGMVNLDVPREVFYQKELTLVVPKGWGPGFDEPDFNSKRLDSTHGHIHWTARENMQQFLDLASEGKVKLTPLITHRFNISEAESAYRDMMQDKSGKYIGVLLGYETQRGEFLAPKVELEGSRVSRQSEKIGVGLIGAGAFATGTMLPFVKKIPAVRLRGVATATGISGKHTGDKFGFEYCSTDYTELLNDPQISCILIATRHDLHARLVVEALRYGKDVFVEKPLALTLEELKDVIQVYKGNSTRRLMVGFNRRFSPFAVKAKELIGEVNEPLVVNCRVNAGFIPKDSWVHDSSQGGGRILGEVCHFIDLTQFLTGSMPVKVYAESIGDTGVYNIDENIVVTVTFKNNSIASIIYIANGDKSFPRERVEIFGGGSVCVIDNYKSLIFTQGSRRKKMTRFNKDSGHWGELQAYFSSIAEGKTLPVNFEEYVYTTLATLGIEKSLTIGLPVAVDFGELSDLR